MELTVSIPSGNAAAIEPEAELAAFIEAERPAAVNMATALVGDPDTGKDVAQEAFVRAFRNWGSFRGDGSRRSWFARILVNCARSYQRRVARQRVLAGLWGEPRRTQRAEPAPDSGLERERIAAALGELTAAQREVFVLVHLHELTVADAADVVGKPIGTVKSHLHRALAGLRRTLAEPEPEEAHG